MQACYLFSKMFITSSSRSFRAFINNWTIKRRRWRKKQNLGSVYLLFSESYTSIPHQITANSVPQLEWHWATTNKPCREGKHVGFYSALCYRHLRYNQPAQSTEYLLVLICQKAINKAICNLYELYNLITKCIKYAPCYNSVIRNSVLFHENDLSE